MVQSSGTGPTTANRRSRSRLALVAALLLAALLAGASPAAADDAPKALTSRRLFDQARPAVQLITVRFSAGLIVPEGTITPANVSALNAIVAGRIQRGEIPATQAAATGAVIDELSRDPFRWITPSGKEHRTDVKLAATGSGFSITPDGYIVTNAHVVAPKSEDITAAFLAREIREGRDDFIEGFRQDGLGEARAARYLNALVRWATRNARLADFKRSISVVGSSGSGTSGRSKPRAARLVVAGEEFPGKDVAVLKIRARNMATLPMGDDSSLSSGDRLFVLGFPGAATFLPVLSESSQEEPTLTQGVLSAKKQVKGGYTVLQTDAGMTHGNSGGPVFDEQGRVVGIATLGSVDPNTGQEVSGLNFAVPASIANELLRGGGVKASEGAAGSAYREALDDIDRQWYKRTLPLLERVRTLDPGHPLAAKLIKDSKTAIAQGRDRTPREILGLPVVVAGGVAAALALVLVLGFALLLRSRRRRRRRARHGRHAPSPAFEPAPQPVPGANGWPTAAPAADNAWPPADNGWAARGNGWAPQPQDNGWATAAPAPTPDNAWPTAAPAPDNAWPTAAPAPDNAWPTAAPAPEPDNAWATAAPPADNGWTAQALDNGWAGNGRGDEWWQSLQPQQPIGAPPSADVTAPMPPVAPTTPVAPTPAAPTASPSWWQAEEAQTPEAPEERRPQPQHQGSSALVCWNCGRHNHPSLHYCEQCWTVLV